MSLTYQEKCLLAKKSRVGDVWVNVKTLRTATVTGIHGMDLELLHESGRVSRKQMHYFAGDFDPIKFAAGVTLKGE